MLKKVKYLLIFIFLLTSITNSAFADLLIIDMQPFFLNRGNLREHKDILIENIIKNIDEAIKNNEHIILVEYHDDEIFPIGNSYDSRFTPYNDESKKTDQQILNATHGYNKVITVIKGSADGSHEIKAELDKHNIAPSFLTVCGVNTDVCIRKTVEGLTREMPEVKKLIDPLSCGAATGQSNHDEAITEMTNSLHNVFIKM